MFDFRFSFRAATSLLLIGTLTGVVPAMGATAVPIPLHDVMQIVGQRPTPVVPAQPGTPRGASDAAARQTAQPATQPAATTSQTPAAPKHHLPTWVWVAIVAGVGLGVGAAVIAGNSQSNKTAPVTSTATVTSGTGVTAGPP